MVKLILKVLILPFVPLLILVKWIGIFLTGCSSFFFHLLAGLFFTIAVSGYLMHLFPGNEALKLLITGFGIFVLPHIAEWILQGISYLTCILSEFIKS